MQKLILHNEVYILIGWCVIFFNWNVIIMLTILIPIEANKQRDKKPLEPTYSNSREEQLSSTKGTTQCLNSP